ncbi:hypothetical protein FOA43_000303 [Brettanomyces nanus]|uniref:Uncharacterized protein n=1 Tax=Eeniella nana TaxID=13502 RepID=A0A875RZA9_EENNA|nr:uncharacterized protein FOA43_000303 [Brettanomyces nanus]QPG72999.1 hypothetical protein FOA43_000303 [Brettanomyces nanus]
MDFIWFIFSIPSVIDTFLTSRHAANSIDGPSDIDKINESKLAEEAIQRSSGYRAVNIPSYFTGELEDSIDLQIKSLLYDYRRLKINALSPFLKQDPTSGGYDFDYVHSSYTKPSDTKEDDFIHNKRLDTIYNLTRFKEELLNNPYRVLIDYIKNRFRSLLILSDSPDQMHQLPELNTAQHFEFLVLRPNDSEEKYVDVLVNKSGIYNEHGVNKKLRMQILMKVMNRQRDLCGPNTFNKDDRASIIKCYLENLGLHIQVERIYRATLKSKRKEACEALIKLSGDKSFETSTNLKRRRSQMVTQDITTGNCLHINEEKPVVVSTNLFDETTPHTNNGRPVTLGCSAEKFENIYISETTSDTHLRASDSESQASSSASSCSTSKFFSTEEKLLFYEQSKMAVRIRIERERLYLI